MLKYCRSTIIFTMLLGMGVALCHSIEEKPLTDQELKAQRPADLGSPTLDITRYPAEQQKNYQIFQEKCSKCHSPARALYSKITTQEDWEHFVTMMHGRFLSRSMGPVWKVEDGRRIIDFLTYDSKLRKTEHKLAFEEDLRKLAVRFDEVQKEKAERQKNQPTQPSAPYTGAKP